MKRQAIFMALLALAFQAQAVPVSVDEAARAARAWVFRGGTLGARLGGVVKRATTQTLPSGAKVHAVQMRGGGAVFLSSDTELAPVIAFTSDDADYSQIDSKSPLWALLCRDARARGAAVKQAVTASASGGVSAAASASGSAASRQWAALLAEGAALDDPTVRQPARAPVLSPGDLRAGPLVQSTWDQGAVGGKDCYNRYTPVLSDGARAVCGCVATAMAQVMRYHGHPTAARSPVTRRCYVEAASRGNPAAVMNLTTQAGVYDWASMPLEPTAGITDAQCEAIGKLTSDAGISVYMSYDLASKGGSGSFLFNVAKALMEVFGYANAAYYTADKDVSANAVVMRRAMFSNFDAGCPVVMGISGDGGHAIVGDGYGYNDGVPYVHLNMGWSGSCDFWYNLPDIDTGFYHFTVFDDLVFNIFPKADEGNATLAGRVTDDAGDAVSGASVRVRTAGAEVADEQTDANGVWGVRLPSGSYEVIVAAAGCPVETRQVTVKATSTAKMTYSGWIVNGSWLEEYKDVPTVTSVGNAWGTDGSDVTLTVPRARIVLGAVTNVYATLDKALAAAKAFAAQPGVPGVAIELLDSIALNATATLDFPCALTAVGAADAAVVTRSGNAALAVAAGGTLALSNVTFAAQSSTAVTVADGGRLVVASGVDFGVPASLAAVSTAASNGLVLAGELAHGFTLDCAAAPDVGGVFGTARCDFPTASNCAARIANARDLHGETRGMAVEDGGAIRLTWGEIPVPVSEAAAYFVDASGATNAAARLDRVLEKYRNQQAAGQVGAACEIVVRDLAGLELTNRLAVAGALTLRGERAGVTIDTFGADAGFEVGTGASLTVKDLVFEGYTGDSLFKVKGGALTLKGGTELRDILGTNTYSGAVTVLAGTATVGSPDGAVIFDGCDNKTLYSCGGAIYLRQVGCGLVLQNHVTITNSHAQEYGGGVYVGKGATVRLSGCLAIQGNDHGSEAKKPSNLYFAWGFSAAQFVLAGPLETGSAVGVWCPSSSGKAGGTFLTVDARFVDRAQILRSCAALTSDKDATLKVVPNDGFSKIAWKKDTGGIQQVEQSEAVARVAANGASEWYGSLEDAFGVLTGNATVEILRDDAYLQNDVTVTNAVTLTSGAGGPFAVSRIGKFVVTAGGALTLANVTVRDGSGPAFEVTAGGALTLAADACIRDMASGETRVGGAITVNGGTLTMLSGAAIRDCRSTTGRDAFACGGAVAADGQSRLRLLGGEIAGCVSNNGGGVYVGNGSTAEIGGDFTATSNVSEAGAPNNLKVAGFQSRIELVASLTGRVGYTPGVSVSSNVFGVVASAFSGTAAQVADSAHAFTHDVTGDVGLAVSGGDKRLLVWSDALGVDGKVTVEGVNYELTPGGATLDAAVDVGQSVRSFVYDGTPKTCVLAGHGFVVSCKPQTNAGGPYTARATVKAGFAWADGTTATTQTYEWEITKADYDMSGVKFEDKMVTYNGKPWSLEIEGDLPDGVTVSYTGNGQTDPGNHRVTATFTGDAVNYKPIPERTATLTIREKADPSDPDLPSPGATTNVPTPIAFQSITRVSETEWTLTVTNRVPWCWYRLLATDDLTKGFVTTGAWEQATAEGAWTTNVTTSSGARFWKAEAKEGEVGK